MWNEKGPGEKEKSAFEKRLGRVSGGIERTLSIMRCFRKIRKC